MKSKLTSILALSIGLAACSGADDSATPDMIDPSAFTETSHTAQQEVLIEETDDFFFARITAVQPTSMGDIIVGDFNAKKFFVFNESGDLIGEIGKEGSGPGEFQSLGKAYVGANDTLFVMDWSSARITAFTETASGTWSHALDIPVQRTQGGSMNGFFHFGSSGMYGLYSQPFRPGGEVATEWPGVAKINRNGEKVGDNLFTYRPFESKIEMGSNFVRVFGVPYGKRGNVVESTNALHVSDNEFFGATTFSLTGDTLNHFKLAAVQRPVTDDLINETFDGDLTSEYYKAVSDVLPQVRPAFDNFQADDAGNVYFGFDNVTEDSDLWLKFSAGGELLASFHLSNDVSINRIVGDRIYGNGGQETSPYVVVYRLTEN
jgi:hypothetical protein